MKLIKDLPFSDYIAEAGHFSNHYFQYLDECPAALQYALEVEKNPPTPDMIEGSCFDIAIQDLAVFKELVIRDEKRKLIAEENDNTGGYTLGYERYDRILVMVDNTWNHPKISQILASGDFQVSVFTELNGVKVKSRPDFLPDHLPIIPDFKTTKASPTPRNLRYESTKYKYYRQGAFYLDQQPDRQAFVLIWIPKVAPYLPVVEEMDEDTINFGRWKYQQGLATYKQCLETGIWPGHWEIRRHEIPKCVMQEEGYDG